MSDENLNINKTQEEIVVEEEKVTKKYKSLKRAKQLSTIGAYILLVILSIVWIYPILWIVLSAFRAEYNDGILDTRIVSHYFPRGFGIENFRMLFAETRFLRWFGNTLLVHLL